VAIKKVGGDYQVTLDDYSGGVRLDHEDMTTIRDNQVQDCLNAILEKNGSKRRPGTVAGSVSFSADIKGATIYREFDGTEHRLCMSGGKVYSVNAALSAKTELYDITGTGEARFVTYLDKCWICNSTGTCKVEGTNAYRIGIAAPTGVAAAPAAGGSLTAGVYTVYACYARTVSGQTLYSQGQNIGTVTLTAGANQTIAITNFANSADPQVNNKVIFLTEPGVTGTSYFYHETGDNTTTSFNITSDTNKETTIVYETVAENNEAIPAFEHIYAFNGMLVGSLNNKVHYSLKSRTDPFKLERFEALAVNYYPYKIDGIFSLGEHLYFNTPHGIIRQPFGDFSVAFVDLNTELYFWDMETVVSYNRNALGLTNDGIKMFDGEKFLDYDISFDVRPEIEKALTTSSGFSPCAALFRRDKRREYHFSYNDDSLSITSNNARLVLNLNKLEFLPKKEVVAPWEKWSNGANYIIVDGSENMINFQGHASAPKVYKETTDNTIDNGIYLRDGTLGTINSLVYWTITTKAIMINLDTWMDWHTFWTMIRMAATVDVTGYIRDSFDLNKNVDVGTGEGSSLWGTDASDLDAFTWGVDDWDTNTIGPRKEFFDDGFKGKQVYLKFEQTANDPNLHLLNVLLQGTPTVDNYV
jgi:hypothetical protein